ncbi:uncharacterized protein LOC131926952 isoform X2 [Physella acuta]|nr:uncharacterized protein LOC131926952 isoform X2 [Physella acuta]
MSHGPILRSQLTRIPNTNTNQNNMLPKSAAARQRRNLETSGHGNQTHSDNVSLYRHRSAEVVSKRQMAAQCGLSALPVTSKVKQEKNSNSSNGEAEKMKPSQTQVIIDNIQQVNLRRGLSGSKVRKGSLGSRTGSVSPRNSSVPDPERLEKTPTFLSATRPLSKKSSVRSSLIDPDDLDENGVVQQYKWNSSDQGLRLQRELSFVNSCRFVKKASEVYAHRVDPMYLMSGAKIGLANRYSINEDEMKKLHEMTQMREGLATTLKKMKYPAAHINTPVRVKHSNPKTAGLKDSTSHQHINNPESLATKASNASTDTDSNGFEPPIETQPQSDVDETQPRSGVDETQPQSDVDETQPQSDVDETQPLFELDETSQEANQ